MIGLSLIVGLFGCGGSNSGSSNTDPDGGTQGAGTGGTTAMVDDLPTRDRPKLSRSVIDFDGAAIFAVGGESPELVGVGAGALYRIGLDGSVSDALHAFEVGPANEPQPVAVVDAEGSLHVFWEVSRTVRHASDRGGSWTEEEIGRGYAPSAVVTPDGRLLLAYAAPGGIDTEPSAAVATLGDDGWTTETLADIGKFTEWVGMAIGPDNKVLVAGVIGDGGNVWLKQEDAPGSWSDLTLDISAHVFMERSADWRFGAGPAGIALHFYANGRKVAFRPADADSFIVSREGPPYAVEDNEPPQLLAPASGTTMTFMDYKRILVLQPGTEYWPVLAGIPWPDCHSGFTEKQVSAAVDGAGNLLIAARGCDGLEVYQETGTLAGDWESTCDALVTATCDEACNCGSAEGSQCAFLLWYDNTGYSDQAGNREGCELSARTELCWNSTRDLADMKACIVSYDSPETCVDPGYPLSEACKTLLRVE